MGEENEYVLGTDAAEDARLRFQHEAWRAYAERAWARAGIGPGSVVLDLGCGPGHATANLADLVGPRGRVIARDKSSRFLEAIEARGVAHVTTSHGPAERLDLPDASIDAAYMRWLLCWLPKPELAIAELFRVVRPGGRVVIQDYFDWGAMTLFPRDERFDTAVRACIASFDAAGGDIDVARRLPRLAREAGFEVESITPIVRIGTPGSDEWRWIGDFFQDYLPKVADPETVSAWRACWTEHTNARGHISTPAMTDLLLVRP